jgi:serine/threonine-protein kinase HipA
MRSANIFYQNHWAGVLWEDAEGYHFRYQAAYLQQPQPEAVSVTLPLQRETFHNQLLFPFFDGLIPEGWLLNIVEQNWKINPRDRMGLLLHTCRDCIGAVSVIPQKASPHES